MLELSNHQRTGYFVIDENIAEGKTGPIRRQDCHGKSSQREKVAATKFGNFGPQLRWSLPNAQQGKPVGKVIDQQRQ
jgi:hypothetical protein